MPGSCPKLGKATFDIQHIGPFFYVVGKVPYSVHFDSYLFGRRIPCRLIIFYPKLSFLDMRNELTENCPFVGASLKTIVEEYNQVEANFSLATLNGTFGPVVTEFLHFDYFYGELYVWSCQELNENYHDIGLLVLRKDGQELKQILPKVKTRIVKYFDIRVVNAVKWETEDRNGTFCRISSTCVTPICSLRQRRETVWFPVVFVTFVIIFRGLAIIVYPSNRVQ